MSMFNFPTEIFGSNAEVTNSTPVFIVIFILLFLLCILLKNKNNPNRSITKNIKRKAYISLNPKQSFQILEYNFKEYVLIVSSDNSVLIDKNEITKHELEIVKKKGERLINE